MSGSSSSSKRLDPMIPKYLSPVDLLSGASYAFEPRKLICATALLGPLTMLVSWMIHLWKLSDDPAGRSLLLLSTAALILCGFTVVFTFLAYMTRRQLEGGEPSIGETVRFVASRLTIAIGLPPVMLAPALGLAGLLRILGEWRNSAESTAQWFAHVEIVPYLLGLGTVAASFVYVMASAYVPAAAAVEAEGFIGALRAAWQNARHQRGRLLLHWVVLAVSIGTILVICLQLASLAIVLPDHLPPPEHDIVPNGHSIALQEGFLYGMGLVLPVSMFSTFSLVSYLALRHPASAPLASTAPDETSTGDEVAMPSPLPTMAETLPGDSEPDHPLPPEEAEAPTPARGTPSASSTPTSVDEEGKTS